MEVKPEWDALKETLELCETEEMKSIAKSMMINSGLKPQQLKMKLNLNIDSTRKSITNVQQASEQLSKLWKDAFTVLVPKGESSSILNEIAKRIVRQKGGFRIRRETSKIAHRPRKEVHANVLKMIVERASTVTDSGILTHQRRHHHVLNPSTVRRYGSK